jgi:hypothetical protein
MVSKMDAEKHIDFLELWKEKIFLGQEFLTWLWLNSEVDSSFPLDEANVIDIWFENTLRLESGQGPSKKTVTCQNTDKENGSQWAEAFTAIKKNKQVINAKLRVRSEEREWSLVLPSDTLSPKSIKIISGGDFKQKDEGQLSLIGSLLDRVTFYIELSNILESLLGRFLELRLSPKWNDEELPRLRGWINRWAEEDNR